jgi:ABC-type multidrug transport system fused ATPase/permease subunit
VVEQDAFVFRASLRYNVAYGLKGVSDAAVDHALRRAGLGEWVDSLGGIHAEIEESGTNMSGGEKQRIALARAIVRDPAVRVLDEATSARDGDVEAKIFADLQDWFAQRTTIVMAHRLSTIVRFPRIIVIDGGRLVGDGNVVDLRRDCAEFAELFGDQLASLEILPRRTPKRPDAVPESLRRVSSGDG